MRYLIPIALLFLGACSQPAAPPEPELEPAVTSPPQAAPAERTAEPPAATAEANSAAEARVIAQAWLEDRYPGREVRLGEPGPMEGAAGSIYIEIPATVTGAPPLGGAVVLRRVNDVPGSTPAQRRWHVVSDTLK